MRFWKTSAIVVTIAAGAVLTPASAAGIGVPEKLGVQAGQATMPAENVHWRYRRHYRGPRVYFYVGPSYYRPYYGYSYYQPYYYHRHNYHRHYWW